MTSPRRHGDRTVSAVRRAIGAGLALALGAGLGLPSGPTAASAATHTAASRASAFHACVSTAFRTDVGRQTVYRIPTLVVTGRGTLVAFAERRRSTAASADISDTEIVTVRSTDHGCHWSRPRVIADQGNGTVGNPSAVVDRDTGQILLFSVYRPKGGTTNHGFHLQRSSDDGRTFTTYRRAGKDLAGTPRWAGGLTGPGHAIQLRSGVHRGRLVVPMGFKQDNRYGGYAVISDDHGATWSVGYKQAGTDGRIEGTAAELADGRLWISYRNRNSHTAVGRGRIAAFSDDGGASLVDGFRNAKLPTVSVQGSALGLTGRYAGTLLFSSPTGRNPNRREDMGIFVSRGRGAGRVWHAPFRLQPGTQPAAYSDLVQLSDTMIGILFETGRRSWIERIDFRSLPISTVVR